jgi:CubicO group peptidase (beta-lactamase class C family)
LSDTAQGYQAMTLGLYADFLLRKIDKQGRSLSEFFRDEISQPFGTSCIKFAFGVIT